MYTCTYIYILFYDVVSYFKNFFKSKIVVVRGQWGVEPVTETPF